MMRLPVTAAAILAITNSLGVNPEKVPSIEPDGVMWEHEYVDLGLPSGTKWATCNIGSSTAYDAGDFFAWGETEPRKDFSWTSYSHFKGYDFDPLTGELYYVLDDIGMDISGTEYDAARILWGGGWRLPNERERYELLVFCWNEWVTENGVNGVRVHGRNGHSIFIPAGGYGSWQGSGVTLEGIQGGCWTGVSLNVDYTWSLEISPSKRGMTLFMDSSGMDSGPDNKALGYNIRPVIGRKDFFMGVDIPSDESVGMRYEDGKIHVDGISGKCLLKMSDLSGRTIFSSMVDSGVCEIPTFANGIYIISIYKDGDRLYTSKITIK